MEKRKLLGSFAIGTLLGVTLAGMTIKARAFTPPASVVWEKGALCQDYAHEIQSGRLFNANATTCPHRDHVMIYQAATSYSEPHMVCKCPRPDGTPDEVWLTGPNHRIRLRCAVNGTDIDSTYNHANDRSYWCD